MIIYSESSWHTLLPSGPSSALLTLAQMRGRPALMVVAWQELDTVDSLAMEVRGISINSIKRRIGDMNL